MDFLRGERWNIFTLLSRLKIPKKNGIAICRYAAKRTKEEKNLIVFLLEFKEYIVSLNGNNFFLVSPEFYC